LVELAQQNEKIIGITPAMPSGSSMKYMMEAFPERALDVGIAEQHAVTLAAGMATQGMVVFCNIYSTFLQRAYDQVIHDVALQNLPVIFCLDRAGLVGEDGATHHGVFDIAYLSCIPNLIICAPKDEIELRNILYTASLGLNHPIAIRYPRGRGKIVDWKKPFETLAIGKAKCLKKGKQIAILSVGTMASNVEKAITKLGQAQKVSHYHFPFIKPLDEKELIDIFEKHKKIITIEDGVIIGGFGSQINSFAASNLFKNKIINLGIPDNFIEHGSISQLQRICKIDVTFIINTITSI
jgi:1-deoxy-D-xylulose-5-phosphate synthase